MMTSKLFTKIRHRSSFRNLSLALLVFAALSGFACQGGDEKAAGNASPAPSAETKKDDFQESLQSVQTGNFDFILAFRRLDGDVFSGDDKKFIKANAPHDTNQWVLTLDGKCVIAGSNYKFMPEHLDALKKRFSVEDYSPQPVFGNGSQANANANANASVNAK